MNKAVLSLVLAFMIHTAGFTQKTKPAATRK